MAEILLHKQEVNLVEEPKQAIDLLELPKQLEKIKSQAIQVLAVMVMDNNLVNKIMTAAREIKN